MAWATDAAETYRFLHSQVQWRQFHIIIGFCSHFSFHTYYSGDFCERRVEGKDDEFIILRDKMEVIKSKAERTKQDGELENTKSVSDP